MRNTLVPVNRDQLLFWFLRFVAAQPRLQRPLNRLLRPFNPFDHRRYADPYPLYLEARSAGPIFYNRAAGTWIVTGFQETTDVLVGPVSVDRSHTIRAITPYRDMKPENLELLLSNMLMQDAPDHRRLRKLVNRAFTMRSVADLQPRIAELADGLMNDLVAEAGPADRPVDVMAGLADLVPTYTIADFLGIPRDQLPELKARCDVIGKFVEPFVGFDAEEMDQAVDEMRILLDQLVSDCNPNPDPDGDPDDGGLIGALVAAEEDGDRLNRTEVISMVLLLLIAGHETTSGLMGNALLALFRNPEQRTKLLEQPDLAKNAVEELLRYDSPIQATDRTALADFEVGGKTIKAGDIILVLFGAANRDPAQHDDPERLAIDRDGPRPISFGHGVHHCVGSALARLEAVTVIPAFVNAFPRYQVDEADIQWRRSTTFRGPKVLPVRLGSPEISSNPDR